MKSPFDIQPDVDRLDAHAEFFERLGELPCSVTTATGTSTAPVTRVIDGWLGSRESNLLVLSGTFGAGKSACMDALLMGVGDDAVAIDYARETVPVETAATARRKKASTARKAGSTTRTNSTARPVAKNAAAQSSAAKGARSATGTGSESRSGPVLIDHFDSLTLATGTQDAPPDLRKVAHLLRDGRKVAVATSRPLSDKGHELVRQLRFRARRESLGIKDPYLVELEPWPTSAIVQASPALGPEEAKHLAAILAAVPEDQTVELRRPMVLRMLLDVLSDLPEGTVPQMGDVYDQFIEHSLSVDYDQGRSNLSATLKQEILTDLAFDIFIGAEVSEGPRAASLPLEKVAERVYGHVQRSRAWRRDSANDYDPLVDFLHTNRVAHAIAGAGPREPEFVFRHPVFYEYFVGLAVAERYAGARPLGVTGQQFSPATLDSLALYFAKRQLDQAAFRTMERLLLSAELEWPDRMLMLYLVEDSESFMSLLEASPADYIANIVAASHQTQWHFMSKIAKFQLVSLGRIAARDYIDYVQEAEEPKDRAVEQQLLRGPSGNIDYLLTRLRNPGQRLSAPIAIYRIAQIDEARAVAALEAYGPTEPDLRQACEEAIERARASRSHGLNVKDVADGRTARS